MGKVESGEARKGQSLILMPNRTPVVVDQLWSDDEEVTLVGPCENVKIKLKGIEEEDVSPGFVLCDPNKPCKIGKVFDAQVIYHCLNIMYETLQTLNICVFGYYYGKCEEK